MTTTIPRVDVLGVQVSATTMDGAVAELARWVDEGECSYVCVTGVHGVMESQADPDLTDIHNRSGLTTTDGMPLVWAARYAGIDPVERVYGPDLMLAVFERSAVEGWCHFLYGGGDGVAETLAASLRDRFPGVEIVGTHTPPFRPLTAAEEDAVVEQINGSGAHFVWVGLSTPKQERWMAAMRPRLTAPGLLGVGAAFDMHSGTVRQAPAWMQRSGLEWLFRLLVEPRRLWRRYLSNNPRFVAKIVRRRPRAVA
ncbi:MAG: WecB/TagA/CpsF family glycosyltransferase [Actinomycetota bacterium]